MQQGKSFRRLYKYIRREVKNKGEKEQFTHVNVEFQRTARRDMKVFLSTQGKEIEETNRLGKTRESFKKMRDTKGTFYAKVSTKKDRNLKNLTESKDLKRCKNTQKDCTRKVLMTQIAIMVRSLTWS